MSRDETVARCPRIENEKDINFDDEWEQSSGVFDSIKKMQDEFDEYIFVLFKLRKKASFFENTLHEYFVLFHQNV